MKTEDLQAQGLTEDQINFVMAENGKDLKKTQKENETLIAERDNWKGRAETAEDTLKGFEGKDFDAIQAERDQWKKKAEDAEKEYKEQIYERDFSDALSTAVEAYKFSSEYAKSAVMAEIKAAGLKLVDGKIIGLNDMIESIKSKDVSAFVSEEQEQAKQNMAKFTTPVNHQPNPGKKYTPEQLMKLKNENPGMDISQYI